MANSNRTGAISKNHMNNFLRYKVNRHNCLRVGQDRNSSKFTLTIDNMCAHHISNYFFLNFRDDLGYFSVPTSIRYPDSSDRKVGNLERLSLEKLENIITEVFRSQFLQDLS